MHSIIIPVHTDIWRRHGWEEEGKNCIGGNGKCCCVTKMRSSWSCMSSSAALGAHRTRSSRSAPELSFRQIRGGRTAHSLLSSRALILIDVHHLAKFVTSQSVVSRSIPTTCSSSDRDAARKCPATAAAASPETASGTCRIRPIGQAEKDPSELFIVCVARLDARLVGLARLVDARLERLQ